MASFLIHSMSRAIADRKGVTAAEYAVMAVALVAAVSAAVAAFAPRLLAAFTSLLPAGT